jgi:hypothetical protein
VDIVRVQRVLNAMAFAEPSAKRLSALCEGLVAPVLYDGWNVQHLRGGPCEGAS